MNREGARRGGAVSISRRSFVRGAAGLGAVGGLGYAGLRAFVSTGSPIAATGDDGPPTTEPADLLDRLADNVVSGGPPKDGIPAVDEPQFVGAADAVFVSDDDVVFGLVLAGEAHAYPQLVLVWHEIVNDRFPDGPISVTYCPLTGSAVGFRGTAPDGDPYTFGTTGKLVNSNLLMYDRQTDSEWPQLLGAAITGVARGEVLDEIPVDWTTWSGWRRAHPDTVVLTTDTGYLRSYGEDPYGSYTPLSGYYESDRLIFGVLHDDDRLPRKDVVIGVKHTDDRLAVSKTLVRERKAVRAAIGGEPVVVLHDPDLDEGRAFLERLPSGETVLSPTDQPGRYEDDSSGSLWDASGTAVDGPLEGETLPRLLSLDVMWFAWAAFYPQTSLIS
ncbi:MAG: DUF3179 domain-containing protein [Acidimicrobiales bacterium]